MSTRHRNAIVLFATLWIATTADSATAQSDVRLLSCGPPFTPDASAATLSQYFGAANVARADIDDAGRERWFRQVIGDREFSSGHPAMQALNPFVYEVWLEYQKAR